LADIGDRLGLAQRSIAGLAGVAQHRQGVHPRVVMQILGHSQISVTMKTYGHVLEDSQRDAAAKIDLVLGAIEEDRVLELASKAQNERSKLSCKTGCKRTKIRFREREEKKTSGIRTGCLAGEPRRTRTYNPLIKSQLLYQLS
jgi:hypothetical protein